MIVALRVETENSKSNTQQLLIKIVLKNYSPSLFLYHYFIIHGQLPPHFLYHHFIIHGQLPPRFFYISPLYHTWKTPPRFLSHDLQKRGKCLPPLLLKTEFLGICYIINFGIDKDIQWTMIFVNINSCWHISTFHYCFLELRTHQICEQIRLKCDQNVHKCDQNAPKNA